MISPTIVGFGHRDSFSVARTQIMHKDGGLHPSNSHSCLIHLQDLHLGIDV